MKKVGILYRPGLSAAERLAQDLGKVGQSSGASVWLCSAWEEERAREMVAGTDLILSVGGDGTILRAVRILFPLLIPILGVNLGKLGFMAELSPGEAIDKVPAFLAGEGEIDERAMLQAELFSPGGKGWEKRPIASFHALNDVVVGRGAISRVVYIKATIDGKLLTTYKGDGVIVATATGSTGYSLSAGGPILHPQAKELLLKPISAHLSLATALVLAPTTTVELEVGTDHQTVLSVDGQVDFRLKSGDLIRVRRSPHVARFLRAQPLASFYRTLVRRLSAKQEV